MALPKNENFRHYLHPPPMLMGIIGVHKKAENGVAAFSYTLEADGDLF